MSQISRWHDNKEFMDEMFSCTHTKEKAENWKALYTILSTIHFLARHGLPLRGSFVAHGCGESNSNFMQPLQVCKDDVPNLSAWLEKSQDQFTSPAIQNEMLEIMATTILSIILLESCFQLESMRPLTFLTTCVLYSVCWWPTQEPWGIQRAT